MTGWKGRSHYAWACMWVSAFSENVLKLCHVWGPPATTTVTYTPIVINVSQTIHSCISNTTHSNNPVTVLVVYLQYKHRGERGRQSGQHLNTSRHWNWPAFTRVSTLAIPITFVLERIDGHSGVLASIVVHPSGVLDKAPAENGQGAWTESLRISGIFTGHVPILLTNQ